MTNKNNISKVNKPLQKALLLLLLFLLTLPCFAFEYTIDTAREEALKNVPVHCILPSSEAAHRAMYHRVLDTNNILTTQQINKKYIDVIYKDLPNVIYRYEYKPSGLYKGYYGNSVKIQYIDNGVKKIASYHCSLFKLHNVVLDVSEDEKYMFDMDGNLLEYIRGNEHKKYGLKWSTIKKHSPTYFGQ